MSSNSPVVRIFSYYYTPLSIALVSNPKSATGLHITGTYATQTHFFNLKKIAYTSIRPKGLPRWLSGKKSARQWRRCKKRGILPWLGTWLVVTSPWLGNGNPLQYSCLGNPMDWGAWPATLHWARKESDKTDHREDFYFSLSLVLIPVSSSTENNLLKWRAIVVDLVPWLYKPERDSNMAP